MIYARCFNLAEIVVFVQVVVVDIIVRVSMVSMVFVVKMIIDLVNYSNPQTNDIHCFKLSS